jgi:hypothetical protein
MTFKNEIKNLGSLLKSKEELEDHIKIEQVKLLSKFYKRDMTDAEVLEIQEKIATKDTQLREVKLSIQLANSTIIDDEGNSNNYYIYQLSILNRKLSVLREIVYRGEQIFESDDKKKVKGATYHQSSLVTKKTYNAKKKDVESQITAVEAERAELNQKLAKFNKSTEISVKIYEGFENFIK